jgi:methylmalonyl-CoA mutase
MPLSLDEFPATDPTAWRAAAEESLKGAPFDKKLLTKTHEGITLQPIYGPADVKSASGDWPGVVPFGRGAEAVPVRPLVAQELPFGTPKLFNEVVLADLPRGQNALAIQLDVATRRGVDPSEADTTEVAACGLSLACLEDIKTALNGVDPASTALFVWAGASALPVLSLVAAQGGAWKGAVLGDPLTEYARDGALPIALDDAYTEMAASVKWSQAHGGSLRTVGVNASLWADAGGTAVEELAFGLATAVEYLRQLADQEISLEDAASQMVFTYTIGSNVFVQIAKFRAARVLWANVLEKCGVPPVPAHVHARGSIFNKSRLDPHTNMLRTTAEGFVGYMAGVQSLHLSPFDDSVRVPGEISRRITRNVHTILAEECDFAATADAAGGSYYVETLTSELADKAWALFQEIEKLGGMTEALRSGFPQNHVAKSAAAKMTAVSSRRDAFIGVNLFPNPSESPLDSSSEPDSRAVHAERASFIEALRPHSHPKTGRSVEAVTEAFTAGATLGQVCESLPRSAACEPEITRLRVVRAAEGFEALRARAWNHKKLHGSAPTAWLANFGPPKQHKARADYASGFLAAGGFLVNQGAGLTSLHDAAKAAVKSHAPVIVLCSTDETYPDIVPGFIEALREMKSQALVLVAGFPKDHVEAFKAAGVNDFIHLRADSLELLTRLHKSLGIGH